MRGLGSASGFTMQLKDLGSLGHIALIQARDQFLALAAKDSRLNKVRSSGLDDTPQFRISIDDKKAGAFGLTPTAINSTLSIAMGGNYVNDFIDRGRVKKFICKPMRLIACSLTILTTGTYATPAMIWCSSLLFPAIIGRLDRHF